MLTLKQACHFFTHWTQHQLFTHSHKPCKFQLTTFLTFQKNLLCVINRVIFNVIIKLFLTSTADKSTTTMSYVPQRVRLKWMHLWAHSKWWSLGSLMDRSACTRISRSFYVHKETTRRSVQSSMMQLFFMYKRNCWRILGPSYRWEPNGQT